VRPILGFDFLSTVPHLAPLLPPLIPYRLLLAGGWIDQPFVSRHNPDPQGSMVVVSLEAQPHYMERSGFATSTRAAAARLWPEGLPDRPHAELVRELYEEENRGRVEPSGSQDMAGIVYPGISRLDYSVGHEGGVFPLHVESCTDPGVVEWLEGVLHILPVAARPEGYETLKEQNLDPHWIGRLGRAGRDCFDAIVRRDVEALGASVNEGMSCWDAILPATSRHPTLTTDWPGLVQEYQSRYSGAMMSASGGGYLFVISEEPVPEATMPSIRVR
jgi:hypothetical protein